MAAVAAAAAAVATSLVAGVQADAADEAGAAAPSYRYVDSADASVDYEPDTWGSYTGNDFFADTGRISPTGAVKPRVTLRWSGGRAQVLASTDHNDQVHGLASVTLDGVAKGDIGYYSDGQTYQRVLFDTGALPQGDHTLVITAKDAAQPPGTGVRISFDALVYGDCLAPDTASCDPPHRGDEISDADFFAALDLTRPGLDAVEQAVNAGNLTTAKQALADYFKAQPNRSMSLEGASRPAPAAGFDTVIADHILAGTIYPKSTSGAFSPPVTGGRSSHYYEVANAYWRTGDPKYADRLGDWFGAYVGAVRAHNLVGLTLSLRVHPQLHAFFAIQDAPYSVVTVDQRIAALKNFLAAACDLSRRNFDPGNDPTNFDAPNIWAMSGNAGATLALTFPEFALSGQWLNNAMIQVDKSFEEFIYEDGWTKEQATGYAGVYALMATGLTALYERMGVTPPTILSSDSAKNAAGIWAWITHPDGTMPMLGDGDASGVSEQTFAGGTTYVDGGSTVWGSNPNPYTDIVEAALDGWYTRGLTRHGLLGEAGELYDEAWMKAVANGGPPEDLPDPSHYFEWAARSVQRSGFDADARYLAFDAGPRGLGSHGHQDKLSFDMFAYGHALLADPGRYSYATSGEKYTYRQWFSSTAAHNTLYVDDCFQKASEATVTTPPADATWTTDSNFDVSIGRYDDGYWQPKVQGAKCTATTAQHRRGVFFVKPDYWIITDRVTNQASGKVTATYHFTEGTATTDPATKSTTFVTDADPQDGSRAGVVVAPGGDTWSSATVDKGSGPVDGSTYPLLDIRGWYAPVFGIKEKTPQATYTRTGALPLASATVVYPFAGATAPTVSTTTLAVSGGSATADPLAIAVTRPGGRDLYATSTIAGTEFSFGSGQDAGNTNGARAFVGRTSAGAVESFAFYQGTHLDVAGAPLVSAAATIQHLSGTYTGNTLALEGRRQPATVTVTAPAAITKVTFDGAPASFTRTGSRLVVTIPAP